MPSQRLYCKSTFTQASLHENPRIPRQRNFAPLWRARATRHRGFTVQEAVEAAQKLGGPVWVVKAQIHAGGRGKGGGVKVAKSIDDVKARASEILGMQLKTHQTGPEGQRCGACTSKKAQIFKRVLPVGGDRPSQPEGGFYRLQRGRHGY